MSLLEALIRDLWDIWRLDVWPLVSFLLFLAAATAVVALVWAGLGWPS